MIHVELSEPDAKILLWAIGAAVMMQPHDGYLLRTLTGIADRIRVEMPAKEAA